MCTVPREVAVIEIVTRLTEIEDVPVIAEVQVMVEIVGSVEPQETLVTERGSHATKLPLGRQGAEAVRMRIDQLSSL